MASITITFTDNGDGTATITTAGATGSAAQSYNGPELQVRCADRSDERSQGLGGPKHPSAGLQLMGNSFALLVQQRPMTPEEEADEKKAAAALQHSPMVAKYPPGQRTGPRVIRFGKPSRPGKAVKSVAEWTKREAERARERKRLPHAARYENIESYVRARRRDHD